MKKIGKPNKNIVNKKAKFEYEVIEELEAGIVLEGREVKSLRLGRGGLVDAFVHISEGEVFLVNADIPGYEFADLTDYDSRRRRKLLMSRKQIEWLEQKIKSKKGTLVPIEIYLKKGMYKVRVALARGRKQFEKREVIKRRDLEREARTEEKIRVR